jgi:hypothetical protein
MLDVHQLKIRVSSIQSSGEEDGMSLAAKVKAAITYV